MQVVIHLYVFSALLKFTYGFVRGNCTDFSQVFQVMAYPQRPPCCVWFPCWGLLWVLSGWCLRADRLPRGPQAYLAADPYGVAPVVLLLAPLILQIFQAARM